MKNTKKIWLILGAALLAFGIITAGAAWAIVGFDFNRLSTYSELERRSYDLPITNGQDIYIKSGSCNIEVDESDDDEVHLSYFENEDVVFDFSADDNCISLVKKSKAYFSLISFGFDDDSTITLEIPKTFNGDISLVSSIGGIDVRNVNAGEFSVHTTTGGSICENINAVSVTAEATTGRLKLDTVSASDSITLKSTTGRMELNKLTAKGGIYAKATTGRITSDFLTSEQAIECSATTGHITVNNIKSPALAVRCTTGAVTGSAIASDNIDIKVTTGNINAEIIGEEFDYTVVSSTTTGTNSLPEAWGSGSKSLTVKSTTGNINVKFADK